MGFCIGFWHFYYQTSKLYLAPFESNTNLDTFQIVPNNAVLIKISFRNHSFVCYFAGTNLFDYLNE